MKADDNIYLVGFMGSGKSTVAARLAEILCRRRIEMDDVIEGRVGMTCSSIFEHYGEERFRELETEVLRDIVRDGVLISCGGGAPLRQENRVLMREKGIVVYLKVAPESVLKRIDTRQNTRPVLAGHMDEEYVEALIRKREPAYAEAADIIITTDGKNIEDICMEITFKLLAYKGRKTNRVAP